MRFYGGNPEVKAGAYRADGLRRLAATGVEGASAALDELLGRMLDCARLEVPLHAEQELESGQIDWLDRLLARLARHEPVAYLLGEVPFHGIRLKTDHRALIPRPETELLVTAALRDLAQGRVRIIDVGTGSGCVAIALAVARPQAEVTAVDLSPEALELARENARLNGADNIRWRLSDLLEGVAPQSHDLVVSNPPYIASEVCRELPRSVREYEPALALDGGADGLELIRRLIGQAAKVLVPGGRLLLEMGYDQGPAVTELLCSIGFTQVVIHRDYAGHDRIAEAVQYG